MILVLLLLLVVVGLAGAGLLGIGVLSADQRAQRTGLLAAASAPVVLVVGIVLTAVLVLGLGGGGPDDAATRPGAATASTTATTGVPPARISPGGATLPTVTILPDDDRRFSDHRPVGGLAPGSVVRVDAHGFVWSGRGTIEQCVVELDRQTACGNSFPVQFSDGGRAEFQFAVRGDLSVGGCRASQPTCLLRLTGPEGDTGSAQIVLVDPPPFGRIAVEPRTDLAVGQTVEVSVTDFPPGTTAAAVICPPPGGYDALRCSAPVSTFSIDSRGAGRGTLTVPAGRPDCGPRRPCAVSVLAGEGFVAAPVAPISFDRGPGVDYEPGRILTGVLIAGALLLIVAAIAWRTDWATPTEAATPELDAADLRTDQDLDDLFGTDQQLDERDPIPW